MSAVFATNLHLRNFSIRITLVSISCGALLAILVASAGAIIPQKWFHLPQSPDQFDCPLTEPVAGQNNITCMQWSGPLAQTLIYCTSGKPVGTHPAHPLPWWSQVMPPTSEKSTMGLNVVSGWPLPAFRSVDHSAAPTPSSPIPTPGIPLMRSKPTGEFQVPLPESLLPWMPTLQSIPLQPLWRGITLDTLFFAAIIFIPLFTARAIRNTIRRARNHCLNCNFNCQGLTQCPECGTPA